MAWETQRPSCQSIVRDGPVIVVQARGGIAWNIHTHKLLGWPELVKLLIDKEAGLLGLKSISQDRPEAFPVRQHGKRAWRIGAVKALREAGLLGTLQRGSAREEGGVVFIELGDPPHTR